MARQIPNANREQLNIIIMKRENSFWNFLALQNYAGRVVLDLQRNIWYTSPGEKKNIFSKNWTQFSMLMTKMVVEKCNVFFSDSYQKMQFKKLKYSTK